MADLRFFALAGPFTAGDLATRVGADLAGAADAGLLLTDVAPLDTAEATHITFLENKKYRAALRVTQAGAAVVAPDAVPLAPAGLTLLVSPAPYVTYAMVAQAFHPEPAPTPGIAVTAVIDPSARLGAGCTVDHHAVIGANVEIGERCHIGANATIGAGCVIGDDVRVGANATVSHCLIGARVRLYPGVRIGQDGFGFAPSRDGHVKVPQLGRVVIGDDVEVGANSTIDRGAGPDTVIGAGTMIDNLVQIGHNVQTGRGCVLVAQVGIAGSTRLGDYVQIGGQGGLTGHLVIGASAKIAAQSGVMRDVAPGETMMGSPAVPIRDHHRQVALIRRLAKNKGD
jgi:UDP-3-O-[3-hydroxymyristoyl] glucosamine N-acyltransferase